MTGRHPRESLLDVLTRPLAARGLDLEDVQISSAGRRRVVRVLIDKDGGVSLDDITEATTDVSAVLDDNDLLGDGPYTLEVTSPGVDRPLTLPRHWRRNLDRLVTVTRSDGATVSGHILDADDTGVVLDGAESASRMAFADIAKARIEIEFSRSARRSAPRASGHPSATDRRGATRLGDSFASPDDDGEE